MVLQATLGEGAGENYPVKPYRKLMEEFMAAAHERRLQAMDAVKAEFQRGYEEEIAELQAQVGACEDDRTSHSLNIIYWNAAQCLDSPSFSWRDYIQAVFSRQSHDGSLFERRAAVPLKLPDIYPKSV